MSLAVVAFGKQRLALGLCVAEMGEQHLGVGLLEIVAGIFLLGLQEHVAISDLVLAPAAVEVEIEDAVDALHIHGEPLKTVGELARDGVASKPPTCWK